MKLAPEVGLSIIVPLYNEKESFPVFLEKLLEFKKTLSQKTEILIIDDASDDGWKIQLEDPDLQVIRHPRNLGNGAAVKTGIRAAKGKYCVVLDADGQHDPAEISLLIKDLGEYHLVVGARDFSSSGQLHRNLANGMYSRLASYVASSRIPDLTSGFRAFEREKAMEIIHLFPNRFSCPTTMTLGFLKLGYSLKFAPIQVSDRIGTSKINIISDGVRFLLIILKIATLFSPMRIFFPTALSMGLSGVLIYAYFLTVEGRFSLWSVVLMTNAITIFMMGLVAEEISSLKLKK